MNSRPYWHVDAKWVIGILLVFVISVALLINSLVLLTQETTAVTMMSTIMAGMFSPEGLDAEGDINEVRAKVLASPERKFQPFPGLSVYITEDDLNSLTPRELRIGIFRQIAEPLYKHGLEEGITLLAPDALPEQQQTLAKDMALLTIVNANTYQLLKKVLIGALLVTAVFIVPFVYFSLGFGRVGNLGLVALLASLPGSLILAIAIKVVDSKGTEIPMEEGSHVLANLLPHVLAPMLRFVSRGYFIATCLGFMLLAIGLVAKLIWPQNGKREGWLSSFKV